MSSVDTDRYNTLVTKSQLKNNFGNDSYSVINERLIPCNELIPFYKDSLFYMHFYNTLYFELYRYNKLTANDLETFYDKIKNLKIAINTTEYNTIADSRERRFGSFDGSGSNQTFTFYTGLFNKYYNDIDFYEYYSTNSGLNLNPNENKEFRFYINLPINEPASFSGTRADVSMKINLNTGAINKTELNYTSNGIRIYNGGSGYPKNETGNKTIYNSDYTPPLVDLSANGLILQSFFKTGISDLQITVNSGGVITGIIPLNAIRGGELSSLVANDENEINKYKPKISNIYLINQTSLNLDFSHIIDTTIATNIVGTNLFEFSYDNRKPYNINESIVINNTYDQNNVRKKQFRKVIYEILKTPTQNIFGYLLYQKLYYNCIICNTTLQLHLRKTYLNFATEPNNLLRLRTEAAINTLATDMITYISLQNTNLENLRNIGNIATSDYVNDKNLVVSRILLLNNLRKDFNNTLETLNSVINNYNRYIKYYSTLKKYVSAIILFLIILIVASVLVTILSSIDYNAKNTYYILILIVLIVIIITYYLKFRHVSLYENFASAAISYSTANYKLDSDSTPFQCTENIFRYGKDLRNLDSATLSTKQQVTANNNNHVIFSNRLFNTELEKYNYTYLLLSNEINSTIFVSNNRVFTEGNNNYLYKLYIEKQKQNDLNKLKKTKYANIIEAIKKQIIYLFNIALLIGLIAIVLVICLMFYNFGVINIIYIITFAVISLIIIMFYINYIMLQQTRMLASKKYWSVNNPSEVTFNQL